MADNKLKTEAYKGVRDFYPEDMAVQRYIFDTWSKTAESFGFARYDASILEPAEIYKAKGVENEEMVGEQTYTFTDRGEREVTLRPEMTPTVARMIAGKKRELSFPVRWYSIPNLFRYERPQRGRLREHWQLNCDLFGGDTLAADIEMVTLAYQTLIDFGAKPEDFEIRINSRSFMNSWYTENGVPDATVQQQITRLNDRKNKISEEEYTSELANLLGNTISVNALKSGLESTDVTQLQPEQSIRQVIEGLISSGIKNVTLDKTLARGFNYYTGTIFEIFDVSGENNRSLLGGGRYDNLTAMFSDEPVSGVGFGMGDVTMRDFLETHDLLPVSVRTTAPRLMIIPMETEQNLAGQKIAQLFRARGLTVAVDIGTKKLGKKIADAAEQGVLFILVLGADELLSGNYTIKNLALETSETGTIDALLTYLSLHN